MSKTMVQWTTTVEGHLLQSRRRTNVCNLVVEKPMQFIRTDSKQRVRSANKIKIRFNSAHCFLRVDANSVQYVNIPLYRFVVSGNICNFWETNHTVPSHLGHIYFVTPLKYKWFKCLLSSLPPTITVSIDVMHCSVMIRYKLCRLYANTNYCIINTYKKHCELY